MEQIRGRINDKIVTPSGCEFYFLGIPLFDIPGIISSQFIQDSRDSLTVKLFTDDTFSFPSIKLIEKCFLDYLGEQMTIDIQVVDEFEERGSGKRPVIISRIT